MSESKICTVMFKKGSHHYDEQDVYRVTRTDVVDGRLQLYRGNDLLFVAAQGEWVGCKMEAIEEAEEGVNEIESGNPLTMMTR